MQTCLHNLGNNSCSFIILSNGKFHLSSSLTSYSKLLPKIQSKFLRRKANCLLPTIPKATLKRNENGKGGKDIQNRYLSFGDSLRPQISFCRALYLPLVLFSSIL